MDERYLNYSHAPIVSPLKKSLRIEMCNDTYFSPDAIKMDSSKSNQVSNEIDKRAFAEHINAPIIIPAAQLFEESGNVMPATEIMILPSESSCRHNNIASSKDKLFYIKYTPDQTMRSRWYLVQIDIESTMEVNPDVLSNGNYWCMFLAKHPEDNKRSDEFSRWWLEWYRYTWCKKSNDVVYGDRILIRPSSTPDSTKFVQWAIELHLAGQETCNLVGPFNFEDINESNRMPQNWLAIIGPNYRTFATFMACYHQHLVQTTTFLLQIWNKPKPGKGKIHKKLTTIGGHPSFELVMSHVFLKNAYTPMNIYQNKGIEQRVMHHAFTLIWLSENISDRYK